MKQEALDWYQLSTKETKKVALVFLEFHSRIPRKRGFPLQKPPKNCFYKAKKGCMFSPVQTKQFSATGFENKIKTRTSKFRWLVGRSSPTNENPEPTISSSSPPLLNQPRSTTKPPPRMGGKQRELFFPWKGRTRPVWDPLQRASVNLDNLLRSLEILERYVLRLRPPVGEPTLYPPLVDLLAGRLFELQVRCRAAALDLQGRLPWLRISSLGSVKNQSKSWEQRQDLLALFRETDRHLTHLRESIRLLPTETSLALGRSPSVLSPASQVLPGMNRKGTQRNSVSLPNFRANRESLFGRSSPTMRTLLPGYEPLGPVPSSLPQTRLRFLQGLNPAFEEAAVERYRLGRYQFLASARARLSLTVLPLLASEFGKRWLYQPSFRFLWNTYHPSAFLSEAQQHVAMQELRGVEASLYFEEMLSHLPNAEIFIGERARELQFPGHQETILHQRRMEVLERYNAESIDALVTLAGDLTFLVVILIALVRLRYEIIILRGVLTELFFALDDPQKCFLLYYGSELLVGYHSKNGWEVGLRATMRRIGLEENEQVIKLAIATVPVMIDTLFKYWVFRHLNRLSPTTTATYYQMIELEKAKESILETSFCRILNRRLSLFFAELGFEVSKPSFNLKNR